jgi:RNA polymerase sigma factor (sigma-70 family)
VNWEGFDQAALLAQLQPLLRRSAAGMLGPEHQRFAEDMAQEAWLQVWRVLGRYDGDEAGLVPWCMAVARNRMRNFIDSEILAQKHGGPGEQAVKEKRAPLTLVGDVTELFEAADREVELDLAYHRGEIWAAIDGLTETQRRYVVARFWFGLERGELARAIGQQSIRNSGALWRNRIRPKLAEQLAHLAG